MTITGNYDMASTLSTLVHDNQKDILSDWMREQRSATSLRSDLMTDKELQQQSSEFLNLFEQALQKDNTSDIDAPEFDTVRQFLSTLSSSRATQGFSPSETATFIFSLKQPLFSRMSKEIDAQLLKDMWRLTSLIDKLGLYTAEQFQFSREDIITRQQQEMLELSTPVAKLWEGILVLPLIGTLDSARTQQVMESLLQKIVETSSSIAIIDITGIPTVDTLVAQHLIKTMSAARLMGAECIVSGIRPQIAQTMVHLGISLQDVITKATLADAVSYAMKQAGYTVVRTVKQ
jgi:rsbT co-antagonist protein RsbR